MKFAAATVLELPLPAVEQLSPSVTDLYVEYCKLQQSSEDGTTVFCDGECKRRTERWVQGRVAREPNVLLVQVRRSARDGRVRRFPVQIEEQLTLPDLPPLELSSVVYHDGISMNAGHYTCACRAPPDGAFWFFDDVAMPRRVPEITVVKPRSVYMLVYTAPGGCSSFAGQGGVPPRDVAEGGDGGSAGGVAGSDSLPGLVGAMAAGVAGGGLGGAVTGSGSGGAAAPLGAASGSAVASGSAGAGTNDGDGAAGLPPPSPPPSRGATASGALSVMGAGAAKRTLAAQYLGEVQLGASAGPGFVGASVGCPAKRRKCDGEGAGSSLLSADPVLWDAASPAGACSGEEESPDEMKLDPSPRGSGASAASGSGDDSAASDLEVSDVDVLCESESDARVYDVIMGLSRVNLGAGVWDSGS